MNTKVDVRVVRSATRQRVRALAIDRSLVGTVVHGHKQVRQSTSGRESRSTVQPGGVFVMPQGSRIDVVNSPSRETGEYTAVMLEFGEDAVAAFLHDAAGHAAGTAIDGCRFIPQDASLQRTLLHAVAALEDDTLSPGLKAHAVRGVLLHLAEQHVCLPTRHGLSTSQRLARLFAQRLHAPWTLADAAAHLSMSVAAVHRRLVDEETTFRRVLREARMTSAFTLLQRRADSVAGVAACVGYESPSRFTLAFRHHFGVLPSRVLAGEAAAAHLSAPVRGALTERAQSAHV